MISLRSYSEGDALVAEADGKAPDGNGVQKVFALPQSKLKTADQAEEFGGPFDSLFKYAEDAGSRALLIQLIRRLSQEIPYSINSEISFCVWPLCKCCIKQRQTEHEDCR